MKYLVLETHLSYSVVLDEAGRFLNVANMNHEPGQYLDAVVPIEPSKIAKVFPAKIIPIFIAVAACFVLVFTMLLNRLPARYASVYLTINPQIQMEVSQDGRVVDLIPLNADGAILVNDLGKWKGQPMEEVAHALLDKAIEYGMLTESSNVLVEIDTDDDAWFQKNGILLRRSIGQYLEETLSVTIEITHYDAGAVQPLPGLPGSSGSGYSDYDDSGYSTPPGTGGNNSHYGNSDYGDSDYGDSDYGNSDYGDSHYR